MKPLLFLTVLLGLLLAGCGTTRTPEPIVITREVAVPVAVSCVPPSLGEVPTYPDSDSALRDASPERFLQLVLAGRDLRIARLGEIEPVVTGCASPTPNPNP